MRTIPLTVLSLCCVVALTIAQGYFPSPYDVQEPESSGGIDINFFFLLFFLLYVYFKESTRVRNVDIEDANLSFGITPIVGR